MSDVDTVLGVVAERISAAGIDCLLIGGFAVNHYGYTRNTLDVDFMIVGEQIDTVRRIMKETGFTSIAVHDNVAFFSRQDSTFRADFLRIDAKTMQTLLSSAVDVSVHGHELKVPALKDLIAMKIFALSHNTAQRMGKDLPDIAYLVVINDLDLAADMRPLCDRFGTDEVYELIRNQVEALHTS